MLHVGKGNSLNLSDLFDAATFRAAAANLMYVAVHCVYKCAIHCGRPAYQMRTLYFCPVISMFMVALWNRANHYIFALWLLLSSFFLFFPRLISAAVDWMSTILPHMVWP